MFHASIVSLQRWQHPHLARAGNGICNGILRRSERAAR
jgi:hypothetical protein